MKKERESKSKGGTFVRGTMSSDVPGGEVRHQEREASKMEVMRKLRARDFGFVRGADTYRQIVLSCAFCDELWISEPIGSTSRAMDDDYIDYILQVSWASGNVPEIDDPEDMSDEERSSMEWMVGGDDRLACPTCGQTFAGEPLN